MPGPGGGGLRALGKLKNLEKRKAEHRERKEIIEGTEEGKPR